MLRILELVRFTNFKRRPTCKPLSLQTVYSSQTHTFSEKGFNLAPCSKPPLPPLPILISKQKHELAQQAIFKQAQIDSHTLEYDTYLIGLTKHPATILGGVFMFPQEIRYFAKWEDLKKECIEQRATIAFFQPKDTLECIKITRLDCRGDLAISYLVHHSLVNPVKVLFAPAEPEEIEKECELAPNCITTNQY